MAEADESPIFFAKDDDPEMQQAYESARATFRYCWREMSWETRRIVPGLDLAAVKMPFSDGDAADPDSDGPDVEHMWISEVAFDGELITGVLLNSPQWLKTVSAGDRASVPVAGISDWMYAIRGRVYGAYTVNLLRSRMPANERKQHDAAWGLDFGDPAVIQLAPAPNASDAPKSGFLGGLFGGKKKPAEPETTLEPPVEHPMSVNMEEPWRKQLESDTGSLTIADEDGWLFMHHLALAGSTTAVSLFLEFGADANSPLPDGRTPLDLAESLGWDATAAVLRAHGGHTSR